MTAPLYGTFTKSTIAATGRQFADGMMLDFISDEIRFAAVSPRNDWLGRIGTIVASAEIAVSTITCGRTEYYRQGKFRKKANHFLGRAGTRDRLWSKLWNCSFGAVGEPFKVEHSAKDI